MQPDAVRNLRSRSKPEGYSDRLLIRWPDAFKNLNGRPSHIDAIIFLAPVQIEVAAFEMRYTVSAAPLRQICRHTAGTGTAAAGHCKAAATLPCPHLKFTFTQNLSKVHIYAVREKFVSLNYRPDFLKLNRLDVIAEKYRVWIAH